MSLSSGGQELIDSLAVAKSDVEVLQALIDLYRSAEEEKGGGGITPSTRNAAASLLDQHHINTRYLDIRGYLMHRDLDEEFPDQTEGGGGDKTLP